MADLLLLNVVQVFESGARVIVEHPGNGCTRQTIHAIEFPIAMIVGAGVYEGNDEVTPDNG